MNNETINFIIAQISTLSKVVVTAVRQNKYSVDVKNFPVKQEVKGTVIVGNQKNLEVETKRLNQSINKSLGEIKVALKPLIPREYPKEIKVNNADQFPKTIVKVPETVKINNLDEITKEVATLGKNLKVILEKLKLDPQINVAAPNVTVKPTDVIVQEKDFDIETPLKLQTANLQRAINKLTEDLMGDDPKKYISARLTDGDKFYKALEEFSVSGGGRFAYKGSDGQGSAGLVNKYRQVEISSDDKYRLLETSKSGTTTYLGEQDIDGGWLITKIVKTGTNNTFRFATIKNNEGAGDFTDAWTDHETLSYGLVINAF